MKVIPYSDACKGEWFLTTTGELRKMVISVEENGIRSMALSKWGSEGMEFEIPSYPIHRTITSKHSSCFPCDAPNWSLIQQVVRREGIVFYITAKRCHPNVTESLIEMNQLFIGGVDSPNDNSIIRMVQKKIVEKLNGSERLLLKGMEEKTRSNLYKVTIGFSCNKQILPQLRRIFTNYNITTRKELFETYSSKSNSLMSENELKCWMFAPQTYIAPPEVLALPTPQYIKKTNPISTEEIKPIRINKHSYDILPLSKKKQSTEGTNHLSKMFIESCESLDIKGNLKLKDTHIGAALIELIFQADNVKFSNLVKLQEDLKMRMGVDHLDITPGKKPNTFAASFKREHRGIVTLGDVLLNNNINLKDVMLPIFIGVDKYGKPIIDDFSRIAHLLVAGSTGSGKSVWLNSLLVFWCLTLNREELLLYLIDVKMVELPPFKDANIVEKVVTDAVEAGALLSNLVDEMNRRYDLFQQTKSRNIKQYRSKGNKLPNICIVIDEFADLYMSNKAIEKDVIKIAQKARACGIHILLCTQRPSIDVVSGLLKSNLPSRVVFRLKSSSDYKTVCDGSVPFKLLGKGDGFCQLEGREDFLRFQGAIVAETEDEVDEIIEKVTNSKTKYTHNINQAENKVLEFKTTLTKKEMVWNFIQDTKDTRLRSVLASVGGDMNEIVSIMKELVEDGLLSSPNGKIKGYRIVDEVEV